MKVRWVKVRMSMGSRELRMAEASSGIPVDNETMQKKRKAEWQNK